MLMPRLNLFIFKKKKSDNSLNKMELSKGRASYGFMDTIAMTKNT